VKKKVKKKKEKKKEKKNKKKKRKKKKNWSLKARKKCVLCEVPDEAGKNLVI
jgi:hypothetical protein